MGYPDRDRRHRERRSRTRPATSEGTSTGHAASGRARRSALWLRGRALSCNVPPEADRATDRRRLPARQAGCRRPGWYRTAGRAPSPAVPTPTAERAGAQGQDGHFRRRRTCRQPPMPTASSSAPRAPSSMPAGRTGLSRAASQRLLDQRARLGDAVERGERAEARPALLADQHLVDHLEEGDRDAGPAFRALLGMVLVALDLARDVERGVLDRLAVGTGRQRAKRVRQAWPAPAVRPRPARDRSLPASRNRRSSGSHSRRAGRARDASAASRPAHSAR